MSKFNKKNLTSIIIQLNIPFGIDVLNSIKEGDIGEPYMVVIDKIPALLKFERIYDFRYKNDGIDIAPFSKIDEDRSGILSYMKIQIHFDNQIFKKNIDKDKIILYSEVFFDISIEYINKFLKLYKHNSDQFWIRNVNKKDIFNYTYHLVDSDKNSITSTSSIPQGNPVKFNGGKEFKLEKSSDKIFRKLLKTNYNDLRNELIYDMQDSFSSGKYNIALLQSVMRFENFVYSNLKSNKISNTKIDKLKKKECGCIIGISEICKRGFKEIFEIDFGNTKEFENLKKYALKYRNKIIHGDIIDDIGKEASYNAIKSVGNAEMYLVENVFTELKQYLRN